jgi:hypothetical protein
MAIDRVQWHDQAIDVATGSTQRIIRTSVCPTASKQYRLRLRATNNKALTVPVGKIVSATKAGSTTATIVFAAAHGLTTNDQIVIYGIRDQTNFANLTTATAVASVVNSTTITIAFGASATITSYGGFVSRVNGSQIQQGVSAQVVQSASITTSVLTLTGSAAWTGVAIGDYVDVYGVRDNTTGADVGIDGAYKVRNVSTTSLVLQPIGSTVIPATLASVNCGGAVIRRTDLRVSWSRIIDFERERVEFTPRPSGDLSIAVPVQGTVTATVSAATVQGAQANNATTVPQPILTSIVGLSANPATGTTARQQQAIGTLIGVPITKPYAIPEAAWNASLALTTTTAAAIQAAAGAGLKRHVTALQAINTGAAAVDLIILDGATERWRLTLPINAPVVFEFPTEIVTTANAALNANLSAAGTVRANFQGYTAP